MEWRSKSRYLWLWYLSSHLTIMHVEALLPRKWLNICLLMGSNGWILYFILFAHAALLHLLNSRYLNPQDF